MAWAGAPEKSPSRKATIAASSFSFRASAGIVHVGTGGTVGNRTGLNRERWRRA